MGPGRGSGRGRDDDGRELSPVQCARRLIESVQGGEGDWEYEAEYLEDLPKTPDGLGLELARGRWRELPDGREHQLNGFGLAAIYCNEQLVGFLWIDPNDQRDQLLLFDTPRYGDRS